jgi:hypothetical protein
MGVVSSFTAFLTLEISSLIHYTSAPRCGTWLVKFCTIIGYNLKKYSEVCFPLASSDAAKKVFISSRVKYNWRKQECNTLLPSRLENSTSWTHIFLIPVNRNAPFLKTGMGPCPTIPKSEKETNNTKSLHYLFKIAILGIPFARKVTDDVEKYKD